MDNVDDFLAHYGKKGMKWGVINDDDGGGSGRSSKKSESSSKKSTGDAYAQAMGDFYKKKDAKQLQAEGQKKLEAQAKTDMPSKKGSTKAKNPDGSPVDPTLAEGKEGGLSRKQKIALGIGAGVAVAGLAYYGNKHLNANKAPPVVPYGKFFDQKDWDRINKHDAELDALFGKDGVRTPRTMNKGGYFYAGLANQKALQRPEFTIPKTTVFQRLSNGQETGEGYNKGTYATFLSNDKKKYGSSQEFGSKKYTVQFTPKEDVRVPSFKTVMDTVKAVGGSDGKPLSDEDTFAYYHGMSGGSWRDPRSTRVIESLKKQGFSALVDDMDAGYLGDLPMVFFGDADKIDAIPRTANDRINDKKDQIGVSGRYA